MERNHFSKLNSWPSFKCSRELFLDFQLLWLWLGPIFNLDFWLRSGPLAVIDSGWGLPWPVYLLWVFCRQPMLTYNAHPWPLWLRGQSPTSSFQSSTWSYNLKAAAAMQHATMKLQPVWPQAHSNQVVTIQARVARSGDKDAGGSCATGTCEPWNTAAKGASSTHNMLYNTPIT